MSLDVDGFTKDIEGGDVMIKISLDHRLLKSARICHCMRMMWVALTKGN